ncbi:uncharacterized protein [Arachis hypogaea]|uniref:uncharacterized protein n=1 Tax=Arachis hypogaea TaxID=3818 RepID=UPI000DED6964|nr:uncharacterized protein LOC112770171 [Arachis hypogaea]
MAATAMTATERSPEDSRSGEEEGEEWWERENGTLEEERVVMRECARARVSGCSAVIQRNLPKKLQDPGSFVIPCNLGDAITRRALCDLGASINLIPASLIKKLGLHREIKPTWISLQLADSSAKIPLGVIEDMIVRVGPFAFPIDFVVLEIEEHKNVSIILGRPFLATRRTFIDVENGKVILRVNEDEFVLDATKAMDYPNVSEECMRIDIIDSLVEETHSVESLEEELQDILEDVSSDKEASEEQEKASKALKVEDKPPKLELMPLASSLKYVFLGDGDTYPVTISSSLKPQEEKALIQVLKTLKIALGWTISDLKGISLTHCMYKIRLEDDARPVKFLEVFMDDFSVFGDSFDSCLDHLALVMNRCQETNLVLNWEKCYFTVTEGIVLGHRISNKGIEVDQAKVEVIERLPSPINVKVIRSFLGHAAFYRMFIKDFSKIAKLLCNLLATDAPFIFNKEYRDAFKTLKAELISAPVISAPDWTLSFELMCDASDHAIAVVLGQRQDKLLHVTYYANRILNDVQRNYTTTEKELLAMVYTIDKFKSYLIASNVIIHTNHAALKSLDPDSIELELEDASQVPTEVSELIGYVTYNPVSQGPLIEVPVALRARTIRATISNPKDPTLFVVF